MHGRIALAYDCGSVVLLSSVIPASPTVKYDAIHSGPAEPYRPAHMPPPRAYRPAPAPGKKKQMEDDMVNGATAWSFTSHWFWEYLWTTGLHSIPTAAGSVLPVLHTRLCHAASLSLPLCR
jgi:hypothetical protein